MSPATASPPLRPSSENCWLADPPIDDRSAVTVRPVLAGFVPGVTATVRVEVSPGNTELGFALPVPDGFVATTAPMPRSEMLSTASAGAFVVVLPVLTESFHARKKVAPLGMETFSVLFETGTVAPGALMKPLLSASGAKLVRKSGPASVQITPSVEWKS